MQLLATHQEHGYYELHQSHLKYPEGRWLRRLNSIAPCVLACERCADLNFMYAVSLKSCQRGWRNGPVAGLPGDAGSIPSHLQGS